MGESGLGGGQVNEDYANNMQKKVRERQVWEFHITALWGKIMAP